MIVLLVLLAIRPDNLDELAAANKYDEALAVCAEAEKLAVKAKDVDGVMRCRDKKRELTFLKTQYEKVREADQKLAADPTDTAASDAMGRFYLFVKGDWSRGMTVLVNAKDPFLKALADKEAAAKTGQEKVAAGDAWMSGSAEIETKGALTGATATANVKADKELVSRARGKMIERALYWWAQGWPLLQDADREKLRPRALAAQMIPGAGQDRKGYDGLGWSPIDPQFTATKSSTFVHGGKTALCVIGNPKVTNGTFSCSTPARLIPEQEYELGCWYLSNGTENRDILSFALKDADGKLFQPVANLEPDTPFWTRTVARFKAPKGAGAVTVSVIVGSKKGKVWIDDVSLIELSTGRELIQNGSFEK